MNKRLLVIVLFVFTIALGACSIGSSVARPDQCSFLQNPARPEAGQPVQGNPPTSQQPPNQPPGNTQPGSSLPPHGESQPELADPEAQPVAEESAAGGYPVVDTGQGNCYNNSAETACPKTGESFYGQDAQYAGLQPNYVENGNGTVSDVNTGLVWQQSPDTNGDGLIDASDKYGVSEMQSYIDALNAQNFGGYSDWRLPSIKELYSLIDFSGIDPSGPEPTGQTPFIDTDYFEFGYGDTNAGERIIDAQFATSTIYASTTMNGAQTMFGVNFADGRIKGYGFSMRGSEKGFYVLAVRGDSSYGINDFFASGDGAVTDRATGLTWQQNDSGSPLDWDDALAYCERLELAGHDDWRLPDAKELQSIVDYSRSPATTNSAAIDPHFSATAITDEGGQTNYPFYWSSSTHINSSRMSGGNAVYVAFGEALGWMQGFGNSSYTLMDVHGAGAQRSDPKTGDPSDYPYGHGPQGDVVRIDNYARCVRGGSQIVEVVAGNSSTPANQTPNGGVPDSPQPPANAAPTGGPGLGGGPPQGAIAACSALAAQMTCSFTSPLGDVITGVCGQIGEQFACIPNNGQPQ